MTLSRRSIAVKLAVSALLAGALVSTTFFGTRAFRSYQLLQSAVEIGLPAVANVRGWMTFAYAATTYDVPIDKLTGALGLPAETPATATFIDIAQSRGVEALTFVKQVQAAIATLAPAHPEGGATGDDDPPSSLAEDALSALLAYRYPALALVLLLGAIGLPVPTGFSTVLAGSMVAIGEMNWVAATSIAVAASVAGDIIGYGIGRLASERFLARYGRWFGLTARHRQRVEALFDHWGGLTVFLTRTLVSHLSSIASLLAGISRYRFAAFLSFAILGRVLWTAAYFELGYLIGNNIEAASNFLGNITGLLLSLGALFVIGSFLLAPRLQPAKPDGGGNA